MTILGIVTKGCIIMYIMGKKGKNAKEKLGGIENMWQMRWRNWEKLESTVNNGRRNYR